MLNILYFVFRKRLFCLGKCVCSQFYYLLSFNIYFYSTYDTRMNTRLRNATFEHAFFTSYICKYAAGPVS